MGELRSIQFNRKQNEKKKKEEKDGAPFWILRTHRQIKKEKTQTESRTQDLEKKKKKKTYQLRIASSTLLSPSVSKDVNKCSRHLRKLSFRATFVTN